MPRPRLLLAATVLLAAAAPAAPAAASARALYVDGASRGGRCSDAVPAERNRLRRPWCSLEHAVRAAPGGATVRVRAGEYPQLRVADVSTSRMVTVTGHRRERPVVAGIELERVSGLRFRRLHLTSGLLARTARRVRLLDSEIALTPAGAATHSGVILVSVEDVVVRGNHVHDGHNGVAIMEARPPSRRVTVAGNHFQRLGNDGVYMEDVSDVAVVRNRFEDVRVRPDVKPDAHADGMQLLGPTSGVAIWGNRFTGGRGILAMVSPDNVGEPGHGHHALVVANNVFLGPDFAVRSFSTPGARIVNNTVWGPSTSTHGGLDLRDRHGETNDRSTDLVLANNVARVLNVQPGVGFAAWRGNLVAGGARGPGDLQGTPAFADLPAGDARLTAGSPGVDAADPGLAPPIDLTGRTRRGRPDAGAYEHGAGTGRVAGMSRIVRSARASVRR